MRRIILIAGSPREGANTDQMIDDAKAVLQKAGASVLVFQIRQQKIGYCMACDACRGEGGACVQKDDASYIIRELKKCDGILFAAPVYFGNIPGMVKALIDRFYVLVQPPREVFDREKETKKLGVLFSFGKGSYTKYAKAAEEVSECFKVTGVNEHQIVLCGGNDTKQSYQKNQKYRGEVQKLAAWLAEE